MSFDAFITRAVRCPLCQTTFTHDQPVPGRLLGRESDLRPQFEGRDPLPAQVLACPGCRYAAYAEGFEAEGELGEEEQLLLQDAAGDPPRSRSAPPDDEELDGLRRFLGRPEAVDGLPPGEPFGAARYVLAARCHEHLREDDLPGVADFYLRASWCARASGEHNLERRCQLEVVQRLRKLLEAGRATGGERPLDERQLPDSDRPRALYLVAELSRRTGAFTAALNAFEELRGAVDPEDEEGARWRERARRLEALASIQSAVGAPWTDALGDDEG